MPDNKQRGLYEKYKVERVDGKPVGICLVLELKDPNARAGIKAFADAVRGSGYIELANDIEALLSNLPLEEMSLREAVRRARGGDPPTQLHGYA